MRKPSAKLRCVANGYTAPNERVIEFSHPNGGGLISLRATDDGRLIVEAYQLDAAVDVRPGSYREGRK